MPSEKDLFSEEDTMVAMSFGDHIEELRTRLIRALLGLVIGVIITFIPPLDLGKRVIKQMEDPATEALRKFYESRAPIRSEQAKKDKAAHQNHRGHHSRGRFRRRTSTRSLRSSTFPSPRRLQAGQMVTLPIRHDQSGMIQTVTDSAERREALISLAPLETMTIYFLVCVVAGLVIASPWVFYQAWAFVGAGLYRHERHYVKKFLPMSLGLFLAGVFLCFFGVLPITLSFLLEFNVWLGIEPTLRLTDWMSFATILPLVFGICFQTPLVMLFLERIGVLTVEDYRAKRKIAILVIVIAGAVLTPGQDPFSQCLLAIPMIILYELGILLISRQKARIKPVMDEEA